MFGAKTVGLLLLGMTFLVAGCVDVDPPPADDDTDDSTVDLGPKGPTGALINLENATQDLSLLTRLANATGTYYHIGTSTFEPTIGTTSTGGIFMTHFRGTGAGAEIRRSLDQGQTWDDATPRLPTGTKMIPNSNDPYLYVDPWTDRIYDFDMCVILQGFCVAFSDDDGDSWTLYSVATGEGVALDHQSLASSPHREGQEPVGYPNILTFCVNRGSPAAGAWCSTSYDAGLSWTPLAPGYPVGTVQCSGLHGHVTGSPDGRFYRGNPSCEGPAVYRSDDGGLTWSEHTITTQTGVQGHEVATATDEDGNVYAFWIGDDGLPYLSWSTDLAETWAAPRMVGAPDVTAAGFPTLEAGAAGAAAWAYIGTDVEDGYDGVENDMEWTGYIGFSIDLLENATITNVPINAADDPLDEGRACGAMRCGGFGDFIDIAIDHEGRPWAAMAHNGHDNAGLVGTLATGPSLRHDGDLAPLPIGGEGIWGS